MTTKDEQTLGTDEEEDKLGIVLMVSMSVGLSMTPVLFWNELFSFLYSLSISGVLGLFILYFGIFGGISYAVIKYSSNNGEKG